jgi:hypothetical protein
MIASMSSDQSGVNVNSVFRDMGNGSVSDGRRRSWENRERSQVIFNGPPLGNPTEDSGRSDLGPPQRCTERQASRKVAALPA